MIVTAVATFLILERSGRIVMRTRFLARNMIASVINFASTSEADTFGVPAAITLALDQAGFTLGGLRRRALELQVRSLLLD